MIGLELWSKLYEQEKHRLRYPSEHVVRWLAGLGEQDGKTALDIGCGTGRHLDVLWDFHVEAWGIDASEAAINQIDHYHEFVEVGDMTDIPHADAEFDLALAYGVFYYGTHHDHVKAIRELHRVLKPGGQALVVTRTFRDSRAKSGHRIDDYTRRMTQGDEAGMLINFLEAPDVLEDYKMFSGLSYELAETTRDERRWRDSDWLIRVTK